jgi:hypothetical protein
MLHTYTFVVIMMCHGVIIHVCVHILSYHNLRLKLKFIYLFIYLQNIIFTVVVIKIIFTYLLNSRF